MHNIGAKSRLMRDGTRFKNETTINNAGVEFS